MRRALWYVSAVTLTGLLAFPALAQEKKGDAPKTDAPKAGEKKNDKGGQPQMSPEEKAMWDEFMKLAAPGEHHKVLATMVGKWTCAGKHRMAPEQPWESWTSTAEFTSLLDGRFVIQKAKGDAPMGEGMPIFEGFGIMGYDSVKKVHTSIWMDNFGTYWVTGDGTCSANCKEITMQSTYPDPMNNFAPVTEKWTYKMDSNDKFTFSTYRPGPDGKEFQTMEIVYTRAK